VSAGQTLDAPGASGSTGSPTKEAKPYEEWLKERVAAEETRKTSLEQRGIAVVTTSGALATLLFGLAAVITGVEKYKPPDNFRPPTIAALLFFIVAGVLAIMTNVPLPYQDVKARALNADKMWLVPDEKQARFIFDYRVKVLQGLQYRNRQKAICCVAAMGAQIIAAIFVALAVWNILR
jgi:hypothetical protein